MYNYIRAPCMCLHSISTRARVVRFLLWSRAWLIFTQASDGKYIFQNGSGASGKRAQQKPIFHLAETHAKLGFADLHEKRSGTLVSPWKCGHGLLGHVGCRKSRKKWKKENKGEQKKKPQPQVQECVGHHADGVVA